MSTVEPLNLLPCDLWVTADDVAECCGVDPGTDTQAPLDAAAEMASFLMFDLSGRQYPGLCSRTVRPCDCDCVCWIPPTFGVWGRSRCRSLSRVLLSGYPVRQITEVLIDGAVIDPSEYRLDGHRWLTRMADTDGTPQRWPGCQRLDLPATEPDTFEITYVYGQEPPLLGVQAASALGCELYRACPSGPGSGGECALPSGVTQIVRQGITMTLAPSLATMLRSGGTGVTAVDSFLAAVNPHHLTRPSAVWSPDIQGFAQEEGI